MSDTRSCSSEFVPISKYERIRHADPNHIPIVWLILSVSFAATTLQAELPEPREGNFTVRDFQFKSGELLPESLATHGHDTQTWAAVWKQYFEELLKTSAH